MIWFPVMFFVYLFMGLGVAGVVVSRMRWPDRASPLEEFITRLATSVVAACVWPLIVFVLAVNVVVRLSKEES